MKKKTYGAIAAALVLGLTSCSDDNPWMGSEGCGTIRLSLSADGSLNASTPKTRADGQDFFTVPEATDFSIRLEHSTTGKVHEFEHDKLIKEKPEIPTGNYKLKAYLSNSDINNEGFDCPYFLGETDVTVLEARETEAHVTAKVANSLVSVNYTQNFKDYMKSNYSSAVVTSLGKTIEMEEGEGKPVFVKPGNVTLNVTIPNPDNNSQTITLQPTSFEAKPGCLYRINLNVNGGSADASLQIEFDETMVMEDFEIDLTEELFTSKAPSVKVSGIDTLIDDVPTIEFLSGDAPEGGEYRFNINAQGGLKEVTLYLKSLSGDYTPSFGNEIELISTPGAQAKLEEMGITCLGIFRNPDKMAYIDFSNVAKYLPAGQYELSVVPKDLLTRVPKDEAKVNIISVFPTLENIVGGTVSYGKKEGTVFVTYNGNPSDITFKAINEWGNYVSSKVMKSEEVAEYDTRAIESKKYRYTIELPDTKREKISVQVFKKGNFEGTVDIDVLGFGAEVDAYATKAIIKISAPSTKLKALINSLEVYNGNEKLQVEKDPSGFITVMGLTQASTYELEIKDSGSEDIEVISFATEEAKDVINGNFGSVSQTVNTGTIWTGGEYTGTALGSPKYHVESSAVRSTPDNWATVNSKTCYSGSVNKNTWFMVPSTWAEGGKVIIRSVGYSHNGVTPGVTTKTTVYYCQNAPSDSQLDKAAGELFLGEYSFVDLVETRKDGISWNSRPSSLSFNYTYSSIGGEQAEAYIYLLDDADRVIGSGVAYLDAAASETTLSVPVSGYTFGNKAKKIKIGFKSTKSGVTPSINIPSETALNDGVTNWLNFTRQQTVNANNYKAVATGSVLTISNVTLKY